VGSGFERFWRKLQSRLEIEKFGDLILYGLLDPAGFDSSFQPLEGDFSKLEEDSNIKQ